MRNGSLCVPLAVDCHSLTISEMDIMFQICRFSPIRSFLVIGLLALSTGCGTKSTETVTIEGKVTLQKKPVSGSITFQSPETGAAFTGKLDSESRYKIEEVVLGEYKVYITPPQLDTPPEGPGDAKKTKIKSSIPKGYQGIESTDLTATVEAEKTSFDFILKPKGPPKSGQQ